MNKVDFAANLHVVEENNSSVETCLLLVNFRNFELPDVVAEEENYISHNQGVTDFLQTDLNYFLTWQTMKKSCI